MRKEGEGVLVVWGTLFDEAEDLIDFCCKEV
jgi:hypothetical protein